MSEIKRKKPGLQNIGRLIFGDESISSKNISSILLKYQPKHILIIGSAEVGAGCKFIYELNNVEIIGLDIYKTATVTILCDAHNLKFSDSYFDLVICQAVLEHVQSPKRVVNEINRVLKAGGVVYSEIPFLQPVHEFPHDYTRYTKEGHKQLFSDYDVFDVGINGGYFNTVAWIFRYLLQSLFRIRHIAVVVSAPIFICAKLLGRFINDKNEFLYTGTFLCAKKRE